MSDDAYDLVAEQALLGTALANPAAHPAVLAVPEAAWWSPKHRGIAVAITARLRSDRPVDPNVILSDLLARAGSNTEIGPYLITLMQRSWSPDSAPDYAERILHCAARRDLSAAATRLRQRLDQSWINGWGEPVGEFTGDMREALDSAELADAGLTGDHPSLDADGLLSTEDEFDWLVPGLLERGERTIITGTEGLGKSWLISQFGVALAAGLHPFTGFPLAARGHPGHRVLIVDCENGWSQSRRRFRNLAGRLNNRFGVSDSWRSNIRFEIRPNGLDLLGRDAAWLEARVAANAPDFLIVGPLYRLHYANLNDEQPSRELVRVLDQLRTRHGCAIMTEAHPGHAEDNAKERRMRPAGSSLFLRWPEFGYGLRRSTDQTDEHPKVVDVVPWRGSREERAWPKKLRHGQFLPWEPAEDDYLEEAG